MSRIGGILTQGYQYVASELFKPLAAALRSHSDWLQKSNVFKSGIFHWCGWQELNIFEGGGLDVVMDGWIFNRESWSPQPNDAALFATLYRQHGFEKTLQLINGDFAIALYDDQKQILWLGRDRFGIKPLYYTMSQGLFAFASRPSALFAFCGNKLRENRRYAAIFAASHYRYFDHDPATSPFEGIAQLPGAYYLRFQNNQCQTQRYWQVTESGDFSGTEEELAVQYRDLLLDASRLRLHSAKHPGFTLSGGMDSSSVLASCVQITGRKQHAFSTVYKDKLYDEREEISTMLDQAVEKWHSLEIEPGNIEDIISQMIRAHDEPVATATWLSHFLLCREVKALGFQSLFGGLGGDELNAGEYEYYYYYFADLRSDGHEDALRHEVALWAKYHDHPIYKKNFEIMESELSKMADLKHPGKCIPHIGRMTRYYQTLNTDYFNLSEFKPGLEHPFRSYLKNRTYQDLTRETAPCSLRAEDRQTAVFGLDNFLPFFDHRLAEFMFRIPAHLKIRDGITKRLLRTAMKGLLPEETRTRIKKTGWNAPAHIWFSGKGRDFLLGLVHSKKFRERGIYRVDEVLRLIDEHEAIVTSGRPQENHMMFLWQLVNLETWFRHYLDVDFRGKH